MFKKRGKEDLTPILVLVGEECWHALGECTPRSEWLVSVLQEIGGINDQVLPGRYLFNAKRCKHSFFKFEVSLQRIED